MTGTESATPASSSSGAPSPLASPKLVLRRDLQVDGHGHASAGAVPAPPAAGAATRTAQRILTLSMERLEIMEVERGRDDVGVRIRPNGEVAEILVLFYPSCLTRKRWRC
jgi:hypothetical protein